MLSAASEPITAQTKKRQRRTTQRRNGPTTIMMMRYPLCCYTILLLSGVIYKPATAWTIPDTITNRRKQYYNSFRSDGSSSSPSMFLPTVETTFPTITLQRPSDQPVASASATATIQLRKPRGTLGFDIQSLTLQAYSRPLSTIDTQSWKRAESFVVRELYDWIPDPSQIETMTVSQLKQELGNRGLKKTGNKKELVQRLLDWGRDQSQRQQLESKLGVSSLGLHKAYGKDHLEQEIQTWEIERYLEESETDTDNTESASSSSSSPSSLAEWARTVDLEPLMKRREAIRYEKDHGKSPKTKKTEQTKLLPRGDYLAQIQKIFENSSTNYSNRQVQELYDAAKTADKAGDRELSKRILLELKTATPNDARVYKRLARLEQEDSNIEAARSILEEAVALFPDNAFLFHGLGSLEGSMGNEKLQIQHFRKAIEVDPSLPHSYHALGTLLHTQGEIAASMKILKKGIEYCPTSHRLHHALGDLYRDAKMLDMATKSYRKALKLGPPVSHGFACTALAYVSYELGQIDQCRQWLHRAVGIHKGRHANGWVSLAQFEESLGNIDAARSACISGIALYERGLLDRSRTIEFDVRSLLEDPVKLRNKLLRSVPQYRSGDRFFNVYRNWVRLEERHGTIDSFEDVYERAMLAFPKQYTIALDAAEYYVKTCMHDKARLRFADACRVTDHAEPYWLFAQFEMSKGNYEQAQRILYSGAMKLLQSNYHKGLAQLFYTWAVCEWHLDNIRHAETLFRYSLDDVTNGRKSRLRSVILFSMAKFEYNRKEYIRAQHYVGLCLQENLLPGGNAPIWELWQDIAFALKDEALARQCEKESVKAELEAENYLSDIKISMRRDPWYQNLFGHGHKDWILELPDDW